MNGKIFFLKKVTWRAPFGRRLHQFVNRNPHAGEITSKNRIKWQELLRHHIKNPTMQAPHRIIVLLDHRQDEQRLVDRRDQLAAAGAHDPVNEPDGRKGEQNPRAVPDPRGGDNSRLLGDGGVGFEKGVVFLDEVSDLDWGDWI